jgi:hypothetical protein
LADGLSNTGIGVLDTKNNDELQKARTFYEELGAFAKLKGINVNIIRYVCFFLLTHTIRLLEIIDHNLLLLC